MYSRVCYFEGVEGFVVSVVWVVLHFYLEFV